MPISCEFHLERGNTVYYTGDEIKGKIILRTQKIILVNAIFVTLAGEAIVQWTKGDDGASTNYHDQQQLLHHRIKVFDGTYFPAGKHVYKISLRIPHNCPSTCEARYGHISYDISVRLDRSWIFDKVFRKPIIVYQTLDLNDDPEYMLPVEDENTKFLCRWPCRSGPIFSSLVIPFGGYIPEESISFLINIDNQSQYDIVGIEASLHQHYVFLAPKPTTRKCFTKILAKTVINKSTLRLSKRIYEASIVVPPATQRSTLRDNYIVSLHYELQVKLKTGRLHYDIVMVVPIVIGTVQLRRLRNGNNGQSRNHDVNLTTDLPSYADCSAPPSFTVATSGSLQTVDSSQHDTNERQRININLPQFPGYNTFLCRTQAENYASYPDLDYVSEENSREIFIRAECRSLDGFAVNTAMHIDNEEP